jgi:hypothetical protein
VTEGWHDGPTPDGDDHRQPRGPDGGVREPPPAAITTLARTSGAGRGPAMLVAAVVIFVGLAILKPWPAGTTPSFSDRPGTPPPTEQPSADPLAGIRLDCQDPPGWRIFSREPWQGGVLRSWRSLIPVSSAGSAADPAIPVIPVSRQIVALGYCAPWTPPERPPDDVAVRIWSVQTDRTGSMDTRLVDPASASATLRPPLGALFVAPPGGSTTILWPEGTWVFELTAPGYERWWGIRIPVDPSASPEPASPVP